jgi:transcriptional regulator of aromatic amino acid metabolism
VLLYCLKTVELRYIQNKEEQQKILKACHLDPTSGHLGIKKTINRITDRYIWPGVVKDVNNMIHVTVCESCQKTNRKLSLQTPELTPIPVKTS